jgi:nitroimidazol reductase NimA-like FMN-containing flavoprotein (pyridoxamine 5'-phosphate oxidase superfamily)
MIFGDDPRVRSTRDCLQWLPERGVGHVACTVGGLPVIVPLPYRHADGPVLLHAVGGPSLLDALDGAIVAFEAEASEPASARLWSVLLIGPAEVMDPGACGKDDSWAGDPVVRITPQIVTARPAPVTHRDV